MLAKATSTDIPWYALQIVEPVVQSADAEYSRLAADRVRGGNVMIVSLA